LIDLTREGELFIVRLNAGPNTIGPAWQARMLEVLDTIESDCAGDAGLVLTGDGKFFCSGLDVEAFTSLEGEALGRFGSAMMELMRRLVVLPIPTVAAINGHAFAAGAFLALACDYRVMRGDRGWVCISEVDVGVPIGEPMMTLLRAKVPAPVARDAVLNGTRYNAEEAVEAGLVDTAASEGNLLNVASERAQTMARKERRIFGTLKRQLYAEVWRGFGGGDL
jgi:enoyl-CoA hydratase/carnithine racemase